MLIFITGIREYVFKAFDVAAGIAWIVISMISGALFREMDSVTLMVGLIFTAVPEVMGSAIAVYEQNIMETTGKYYDRNFGG